MAITGTQPGHLKRIYLSRLAETETTWGGTAQTLAQVINPLRGSGGMRSTVRKLVNGEAASGYEHSTRIINGGELVEGGYSLWLTPEALGIFGTMALGACGAATAVGSGYSHQITLASDRCGSPHTLEQHTYGVSSTTEALKFRGVVCDSFDIGWGSGNQIATFNVDLFGAQYETGADQSALETVIGANWPGIPGFPSGKIATYITETGANHASAFDGAIAAPSAQGTPFEDLTGTPTNYGPYTQSATLNYANNFDRDGAFQAGTSTGAGLYAQKPFAGNRVMTLNLTLDWNGVSDTFTIDDRTTGDPKSYTIQITGVSDKLAATGCYYAFSIVMNAAYVTDVSAPTGDPQTYTVSFEAMQAAENADADIDAPFIIWTFDALNVDFDATA